MPIDRLAVGAVPTHVGQCRRAAPAVPVRNVAAADGRLPAAEGDQRLRRTAAGSAFFSTSFQSNQEIALSWQ